MNNRKVTRGDVIEFVGGRDCYVKLKVLTTPEYSDNVDAYVCDVEHLEDTLFYKGYVEEGYLIGTEEQPDSNRTTLKYKIITSAIKNYPKEKLL